MPSEAPLRLPRITPATPGEALERVRRALSGPGDAYRTSLVEALEDARAGLRRVRSAGNGRPERAAEELGALALGPLDAGRFAALLDPAESHDPAHLRRFERAVTVLETAVERASSLEPTKVATGETLRDAVARALQRRGRAFGAVRTLALLRTGAFLEQEHDRLVDGVPFREWRSMERDLATPLLVAVDGAALDTVCGLAEFLDGSQKIVLLVGGPCPPAPLARLLAPGTLVLQTCEAEELERVVTFPGPAVVALVPESAARFAYGPDGPYARAETLRIDHVPETAPRGWLGGISPRQQATELRLLEAWSRQTAAARVPATGPDDAGAPEAPSGPGATTPEGRAPAAPPEPAERLAAWLLSQATPGAEADG